MSPAAPSIQVPAVYSTTAAQSATIITIGVIEKAAEAGRGRFCMRVSYLAVMLLSAVAMLK
jgi:hypothetical protein